MMTCVVSPESQGGFCWLVKLLSRWRQSRRNCRRTFRRSDVVPVRVRAEGVQQTGRDFRSAQGYG